MKHLKLSLLYFLLHSISQILGVRIESSSLVNADGFLQTELDVTVSVTCQAEGDIEVQGQKELLWLRNGAVVQLNPNNNKGRSSVCVSPVTLDDHAATFTCQEKADASLNASVTLNVTYAPMLSGMDNVTVKVEVEAELLLQCDVRANPPVSVSWQHDGSPPNLALGGFMLTNDGVTSQLRVNKVDRILHQGTYLCVTESPLYGRCSKHFQVIVNEKTLKFPLMPMVAGIVVVCCTMLIAIVSRWNKIIKCCRQN